MPATARQIERYWTTEPPDDEPMQTCPECEGTGCPFPKGAPDWVCERCDGTGTVPVDGSDAADVAGDRLYDARVGA